MTKEQFAILAAGFALTASAASAQLTASPARYTGRCPTKISFSGAFTVFTSPDETPAQAETAYQTLRSDGSKSPVTIVHPRIARTPIGDQIAVSDAVVVRAPSTPDSWIRGWVQVKSWKVSKGMSSAQTGPKAAYSALCTSAFRR